MLRRAGVPARLVVGHKVEGASNGVSAINEQTGHAWSEVWDGSAWRRVDATKPKPEDKKPKMRMTREKQDGAEEADDGGVEPPQDNAEDGDEGDNGEESDESSDGEKKIVRVRKASPERKTRREGQKVKNLNRENQVNPESRGKF